MKQVFIIAILILLFSHCKRPVSNLDIPSPKQSPYASDTLNLSADAFYDKVLGALVGSAIGDAMGTSTEMWHRKDIQLKYGYISGLTPAVREQSPEGTWDHNLAAGTTTDDTRWKFAIVKYLTKQKGEWNGDNFSDFIIQYYAALTQRLSEVDKIPKTDSLDTQIEKIDWIKEWARVAMAYKEGPKEYQKALNRFYGGEMSCAGQLYTPVFGMVAKTPLEAYMIAYDHALFDLGYAKDISGLVAAMTQVAMRTKDIDSIISTATFIDPIGYQDSRLVGRISYVVADASVKSVLAVKNLVLADTLTAKDSILYRMPEGYTGTQKDWLRQESIYQNLEKDKKAIAFHTGEIWQILITSLQFGEGDFEKTMQFIVNYGRDNDTVAAIAGMILGAKNGYSGLPVALRTEVVRVSKENMGIDLEELAHELVELSP